MENMPLPGELCFFIHLKAGSIFPLAAPIKNKACRGPFFISKLIPSVCFTLSF